MIIQESKILDLLAEYRCSSVEMDNLIELQIMLRSVFIKNHVHELVLKIPYSHFLFYTEGNKIFLLRRLRRMGHSMICSI